MTKPSYRVLVVDDDAAARRMMRRLLERRGHTVLECADGKSAIEILTEQRPDIVLMDVRMPGEMSGIDATRAAKDDPSLAQIPIVIVSASVHADARAQIMASGCNAFIEKPVDFDLLDSTLAELLE